MAFFSSHILNYPFASTLLPRVNVSFTPRHLANTGILKLYITLFALVTTAIVMYIILRVFSMPICLSCRLCVLLGINSAAIRFNIMPEGGHQSFSKDKLLYS